MIVNRALRCGPSRSDGHGVHPFTWCQELDQYVETGIADSQYDVSV